MECQRTVEPRGRGYEGSVRAVKLLAGSNRENFSLQVRKYLV